MKGAGQKCKLEPDNPGLIAGAAALNGSTSPKMATEICNAVNQIKFPEKFEEKYKICRNTFMNTLETYTDYDCRAVLRRKTGKKDPSSDWAVARRTFAAQRHKAAILKTVQRRLRGLVIVQRQKLNTSEKTYLLMPQQWPPSIRWWPI